MLFEMSEFVINNYNVLPNFAPKYLMLRYMRFFVMALMAFVLCSCAKETKPTVIHSVVTTTPAPVGTQSVKNFSGVVRENAETNLSFKTAGQLEHIYVKEGDRVSSGQLLAVLDDKDYKLGVEATQIQYDQTKAEVERMKVLFEGNSLSANDYEKAMSGLKQLGVQLQVNKNKLSYTRLYAPASGVIKSVNFERMEMVDAGTPVFVMLDLHSLEVEVNLPADVYAQRNNLIDAYCTANSEQFPLQLRSIVPKADSNQLFTAKFALKGNVSAGKSVDVVLTIGVPSAHTDTSAVCTVPQHSVFEEGGKQYVWQVKADSTVVKRPIEVLGTDDHGNIMVSASLDGSETIVRAGVGVLKENEKVKIVGKASDTNVGGLI